MNAVVGFFGFLIILGSVVLLAMWIMLPFLVRRMDRRVEQMQANIAESNRAMIEELRQIRRLSAAQAGGKAAGLDLDVVDDSAPIRM